MSLAVVPSAAEVIPAPESVLGFRIGQDRLLADWGQVVSYFRALDAASPRITTLEVGTSTEGRPFLVVIATSEANMARLAEIRRDNLRLADPRGLSEEDADRLVRDGRTIVVSSHGIHSTEVASTLTAMELAYRLAASHDGVLPEILDGTVTLIIPSQNPDGTQKVAEYYRKTVGTPYEGGPIPFLYHPYAGHDNNRDWYMQSLKETRLAVEHVHEAWRPQILHDLHQMSAYAARIFLPPYVDPHEPNIDTISVATTSALGAHIAARLVGQGKKGVVIHALYDAWSPSRTYITSHGGVRILSECASARLASPIEVPFRELRAGLGYDPKRVSWNHPDPWPGGVWRLADIVDYQLAASLALLEHASKHRSDWLRSFLDVNRRGSGRSTPFAFVIPADQKDPWATAGLLAVLRRGGVEIARARRAFGSADRSFPAGAFVVRMAQPASAFAKMLLERQHYPDLRVFPNGPPQQAFDATAHTLPLLMGVDVVEASAPFVADLEDVSEVRVEEGRVEAGRGRYLAFGHKNGDLLALSRLLGAGIPVRWATQGFIDRGRRFPAGTLMAPHSARRRLLSLAREFGLAVFSVSGKPPSLILSRPRVGLYQSWVPSPDEGWTRFVFEHHAGIPYRTLHDEDVRRGDLVARFDAIVLPGGKPEEMRKGHPLGSVPEEYAGGLGREGGAALKAFAERGGTIVALNSAGDFLITELGLPVINVVGPEPSRPPGTHEAASKEFYCPGSLLRTRLQGDDPLGHGLEKETSIWFENSPVFEVQSGNVVLRYPEENPLLSGWLVGEGRLHGRAALVELPCGKGRAILFGFRPQYRAQSWATYIPLLNALYTSAARPDGARARRAGRPSSTQRGIVERGIPVGLPDEGLSFDRVSRVR